MFHERLTELRKGKNLTQEMLAKTIGISRATYAQYEIGRRQPDYETLEKLADFFNVSVDYLLGRKIENVHVDNELSPEELQLLETLRHEEVAYKDLLSSPIEKKREFLRAWKLFQEMDKEREENKK